MKIRITLTGGHGGELDNHVCEAIDDDRGFTEALVAYLLENQITLAFGDTIRITETEG